MQTVASNTWMKRAFLLALPVIGGFSASEAKACAVVAFATDPTTHEFYFQFSTDVPFDAWRMVVKPVGGGPRSVTGGHPHGGAAGASGVITGLNCGTTYRFRLQIKCNHGDPWMTVRGGTFTTNACP